MKFDDIVKKYKCATIEKERAICIEKMLQCRNEWVDIEAHLLKVMNEIDSEDYSKLIGYFRPIQNSHIIVEKNLIQLIRDVSSTNFKNFIHILKNYYPEVELSNYQMLFENKMSRLCNRIDTHHQYMEVEKILSTNIFLYSIEHYLVEDLLVKQLEDAYQVSFYGNNEIYKKKIYECLYRLKELAQKQNSIDRIEYIDFGSTSIVLKIGNYVIKFGGQRAMNKIMEHPRILNSFYYHYFEDSYMAIEVQPFVDTSDIPVFVEYDIIVELYESGIAWFDSGNRNIGRLEDGTYVICDIDYLYDINELEIEEQKRAFELYRYAKEKQSSTTLKKQFFHKNS